MKVLTAILVSWSLGASAAVIKTVDDSYTNVSAAYATAMDGDIIQVGQGTNNWNSAVIITNNVIITSTNAATTWITQTGAGSVMAIQSGTKFGGIYGFTITEIAGGSSFGVVQLGQYGITNSAYRFASNTVYCTGKGVLVEGSPPSDGVIDHNTFIKSANASINGLYLDATTLDATNSWAYGPQYGTTNKVYIEYNYFDWGAYPGANGLMDCYGGQRFVFRFNTVSNTWIEAHGTDSTPNKRSTHDWEVYQNTWNVSSNIAFQAQLRGGTGLWWSNAVNTFNGASAGGVQITIFRVANLYSWGYITGSNALDGNTDGGGYPAFDQPGRTGPTTFNAGNTVQTLSMVYGWSNTLNGVLTAMVANSTSSNASTGDSESQLMVNGRDYTNAAMAGYVPLGQHPLDPISGVSGPAASGTVNAVHAYVGSMHGP